MVAAMISRASALVILSVSILGSRCERFSVRIVRFLGVYVL